MTLLLTKRNINTYDDRVVQKVVTSLFLCKFAAMSMTYWIKPYVGFVLSCNLAVVTANIIIISYILQLIQQTLLPNNWTGCWNV